MSTRDRLSRLTAGLLHPLASTDAVPLGTPAGPQVPTMEGGLPPSSNTDVGGASDGVETRFPAVSPRPAGKRTGPGELLAFRGQMLAAEGEVSRLRDALARFDGSLPTKRLDPQQVRPSRWANRHEASFATAEFVRFKADIEHAGGNVQPILVRPIADEADRYEIVFGHRRHRACLEAGLPVLAAICAEPLPDSELFAAMDRENRERADLSPWEQGAMYCRALEEQMFPSQRRLAESLGISHTWVRKTITVAELPEPIVECFRSPLEITFRHAEEIAGALQTDRKGVLRRAEKLRQSERFSASAVVAALVGKHRGAAELPREIRVGEKVVGRVSWDARGQATVRLLPGVVHAENIDAFVKALSGAVEGSH